MGSFTRSLTRLQWNCQLGLQGHLRRKASCKLTWFLAEFISLQLQNSQQLASLRAVYANLWAQESPKASFKEFTWLSQAHLELSLWLTQSHLVRDLSLHHLHYLIASEQGYPIIFTGPADTQREGFIQGCGSLGLILRSYPPHAGADIFKKAG